MVFFLLFPFSFSGFLVDGVLSELALEFYLFPANFPLWCFALCSDFPQNHLTGLPLCDRAGFRVCQL